MGFRHDLRTAAPLQPSAQIADGLPAESVLPVQPVSDLPFATRTRGTRGRPPSHVQCHCGITRRTPIACVRKVSALSTIHQVETDDDYLNRRVQPLAAHWRDNCCGWPEQRLVGDHCDIVLDALTLSLEDRNAVTVWMEDAQYTGPVVKLSDTGGAIVDLDEFGNRDHEVAFRVSEIDALDFGCEHQRIAQFLMKTGEER